MSIFKKANEDDILFDPRQKGSDLDSYYGSKHPDVTHNDDTDDQDLNFDPRQKGSNLDDYMAQHQHLMPMRYKKKKTTFKIRRKPE